MARTAKAAAAAPSAPHVRQRGASAATPDAAADEALALYRRKRDFSQTPEPAEPGTPVAGHLQYVVQKHWASRLHYDLRLEIGGTMKSWAVPKGPSYDPADKRMAVQVEDHPISYNSFEGQIPPHQYGAGRVIVWDRGTWTPVGDPAEGYRKGKLKFALHGHKLQGHWTLVRMHGRGSEKQPPWLWIKERDGLERSAAEFSVVEEWPDSVAHLPAEGPARVASAPPTEGGDAAPKGALPAALAPQLATLVDAPPRDTGEWIWELKFDGYRLLARVDAGAARLYTRNGNDWTSKMPALAQALSALPLKSGWIDGEVLVLDAHGIPDFQALQNAFDGKGTDALVFYAFDLPYADGLDLRGQGAAQRRERLRAVVQGAASDVVRFSEAFEARPADLVASACRLGFEGVIGKRKGAPYVSRRSPDWIKLKCSHRQEFVIGGYTDPQGTRSGFGSLLLGVHAPDGSLQYAGSVGTGFSERVLADLHRQLRALATQQCPFAQPRAIGRKAHWVEPVLLAEVSFAEWTKDNRVRHAVFRGLRSDKPPQAIVREVPAAMEGPRIMSSQRKSPPPTSLRVTHGDRVIDPSTGITKMDLVRYYAAVAPLMEPHLKGRPLSLLRAPAGLGGELFFQKHMDKGVIDGVVQLPRDLDPDHPPLMEVQGAPGLLAAAQMNAVEFHTWNARKDRIDRPDRMTFDLDPGEGVPWEQVQEAASLVQVLLKELGLPAFLKTSGGKGLHVVVPLKRLHDWDTVKGFSQAVVQHLARSVPQRFVSKSGPRNRVGKIFADYLRNGFGATTASAWTARARPGMGISVPVSWAELPVLSSGAHWTVSSVEERLRAGNAPWIEYGTSAVSLTAAMKLLGYRKG